MGFQRNFQPDSLYHIITRGNNKRDIFLHKRDYPRYLNSLEKYSQKFSVKIIAYCLMPNHVHVLINSGLEKAVSDFMHALNTSYTMYFNLKHSSSGHLFQGPFRHINIESDEYLVHLSRYIHLNPSSAGITKNLEDYQWSSYRHYLGLEKLNFIQEKTILDYFSSRNPISDYKEFVESRVAYQRDVSPQKLFLE